MLFDFYDRYEDFEAVGSAITPRDGFVLSVVVHGAVVLLLLFAPSLAWLFPTPVEPTPQAEQQPRPRDDETPRFVVVEPLRDVPAPTPPPKAEVSDLDRQAAAPEITERPENPLPFARGDTAERVEAAPEEPGQGPRSRTGAVAAGGAARGADARCPRPPTRRRPRAPPRPRARRAVRWAKRCATCRSTSSASRSTTRRAASTSSGRPSSSTPRASSSGRGSAASSPR